MRKGHFRVVVGGQDVTSRFVPLLISLSITKSGTEATHSATFTLDDKDATVRFPKTGTPVSIELG
ncbi:MAG: late control protein, partial [Mesorhizobium sp.]